MIEQDMLLRWITAIAAFGAWVFAWYTRRDDKTEKKINDLERALDANTVRLVKVETQLEDMPSKEDYHKIDLALTSMQGQLGVVIESVKPIKSIASRLQDMLIEGHKK